MLAAPAAIVHPRERMAKTYLPAEPRNPTDQPVVPHADEAVRRETLAGTPNRNLARDVRAQAKQALAALESGLADYGIKNS
jgi:hypothetical protein